MNPFPDLCFRLVPPGGCGALADSERWQTLFFCVLLTAASLLVFCPALGQTRHLASREIRHAEIIREMAESGDYLVPKLLGENYYDKPPLMHALAAWLTRWTGRPSMFLARLPSAVAAMVAVLATYGLGLVLYERKTALVAAFALLGIPGFGIMAREARPDMIMCAAILLSCLAMTMGMRCKRRSRRLAYSMLAGIMAGLGVLAKGPFGLLLPVLFAVLAPIRRRDLQLPRVGWIGFVFGFLLLVSLWVVPVYLRDKGAYLLGVLGQPDLKIYSAGSGKPFYSYVPVFLLYGFPMCLFLPIAIADVRRHGCSAPLSLAAVFFLILSLLPQKRTHYLVPMYPFLALGIAHVLLRHAATNRFIRQTAWTIIPLSIAVTPIYFGLILPITSPPEDPDLHFAKHVLAVVESNAPIYCVQSGAEALAWMARRHDGIHTLKRDDPDAGFVLRNARSGSYLVMKGRLYMPFFEHTGPIPCQKVFEEWVNSESMLLLRLGG